MDAKLLRKKSNLGKKGLVIIGKNEVIAFFRNKGLILSQLLQPVLYVVFIIIGLSASIGEVAYHGHSIPYAIYATIGIFAMLIISQLSQVIYRVTIDKRYGLLALKLSSGVRPTYYILGMSIYPALGLIIQEVITYIIMRLFHVGQINIGAFFITIILSLIILVFWTSLGILITMFINNYQKRDILIRFLLTPLGFTAPVFYVMTSAPLFVQVLGYLNPLTYQLMAIRDVAFGFINVTLLIIVITSTIVMFGITSYTISKIKLVLKEL